ncbi:Nucleoporin [Wickerhamomyces ciferrii]|uniref:Nucleoporin n=1 Tax=Wickerhamomyces ciferrii (strain ATCC 14091 / BCRC 22168 / CBS 111 / JCM 3599 / NBRC 0793 / NRRL Y-1031 F-60-10) TaxID=1206466 RepID=K0KEJ6_WICCF|nr:Nucleoporin [Wickerhamomyces ciferrii]CCH43560.1 Nucleoporin [Wickerhamomyces ciferrii]
MSKLGDEFISTSSEVCSPIQLITDYEEKLPFSHINNFTSAPQHGWFAASGKDKIILGSIKDLKQDVINEESKYNTNRHEIEFQNVISTSFTKDEKQFIVITPQAVHYAPISDYKSLSSNDFKSIDIGTSSIDLAIVSPLNSSLVAILGTDGELSILDITTGSKNVIFREVVYFSWSPKGKQIAIATKDGFIKQITTSGEVKLTIDRPEDLKEDGILPISLQWIAPFRFLVIFGEIPNEDEEDPSYEFKAFVLTHEKSTGETSFEENFDLIPAFGSILRKPTIYSSSFHNLSGSMNLLTIVASSTSVEISALLYSEVILPESDAARAALPIDDNTGNDINAIGLITDISDTGRIEEPCQGVSEANWLPAVWVLGNDGKVQGWYIYHVHDLKNGTFKQDGVKDYEDSLYKTALDGIPASSTVPSTASTHTETKPSGFGSSQPQSTSPFASFNSGNTSTTTDNKSPFASFNQPQSDNKSLFGTSGVGQTTTDNKSPFGTSGLGQTATDNKSPFASFGNNDQKDDKPAFGSSGFGQSKSAFGSSGFGSSGFGQTSTDSKPAFGSSSFGQTTSENKPAFGSTGFGSSSFGQSTANKPAFGSSGFGQSSFGKSSTDGKPSFGSSGFGSSSFGSSATDNKPAFGSSSFGSSTFGQSNTNAQSPFGALGSGQTSNPAFGSSTFGQNSGNSQSPFGDLGASQTSKDEKPAFGSTTFGQSSTANKSAFGSSTSGQSSADSKESSSGSSLFGQTPSKNPNPAPFASPASGTAGFGKSPDKPAAKPAFGSPFTTVSSKPAFGGKIEDSPFGKKLSDDESPFAKFGTNKTETKSPFDSAQPFGTNETSSIFSKASKETAQSSLNESQKDTKQDKSSLNTLSGDLGGSLFGSESQSSAPKTKVPGLSDSEDDDSEDSELEESKIEDSDDESDKPINQPTTSKGPTSFGGSTGPTSFGSTGPTSFGSTTFGSTGFGSTAFGSSGFKFGQQPQKPTSNKSEDKVEKPVFGGFGQFASQNKLEDLSKQKNVFEKETSSTEKKETEVLPPQDSKAEEETPEEVKSEENGEEEDDDAEAEDSEAPETTYDEGYTEGATEDQFHKFDDEEEEEDDDDDEDEEEEDDEDEEDTTQQQDDTRDFESEDNNESEDLSADELGDEIDKNLNIDEEDEETKNDEEHDDHEFENVREEDTRDSSSLDSYKDKEDEVLYKEAQSQKDQEETINTSSQEKAVQSERPPYVHKSVSAEVVTKEIGVSATVETSEIDVQTDDVKFESIALQSFEDDEIYFGSHFIPSEVPNYERLLSVKYPTLSQDPIFRQLEKIYYDTQAEISIIESNCTNLGKFLDDHLKSDLVNTEASLSQPHHWRLSEAANLSKIISKYGQDASKTKESIIAEEKQIKLVQDKLDLLEKQSIRVREKVLSLTKLSDKAVLNARDLPIDVLILQDKIRKNHAQVLQDLRASESKILSLKTSTNVFYNEPPTPDALQSIINHINSITRDYSKETRELTEQIANLNINHAKILEKLHDGKDESFKQDILGNKGLTKLRIEDLNKKMEAKQALGEALQSRPVKTVVVNL